MGFWIYMLAMDLILPLSMILFGRRFMKTAPGKPSKEVMRQRFLQDFIRGRAAAKEFSEMFLPRVSLAEQFRFLQNMEL